MDSINFFKGYAKVNDPSSFVSAERVIQRRRIILATWLTIFLTIIIVASIGALIHESATESEEQEQEQHPSSSHSDESLRTVCSVTQHLDSCVDSISSLNHPPKSDPVHFFNLSVQASIRELKNLSALPRALISKTNDQRAALALKDCINLFDDSVSQLNNSAELMKKVVVVGPGEKLLTEMKISDMRTWISAAVTDQETCLDGLDEMGSTVVNEVRTRVQKSKEYMSNSLAILNNLKNLLDKSGQTMP